MTPELAKAISDYLREGGKVSKFPPAVPVSAREVVEYLISRGVAVRLPRNATAPTYFYNDKQVTLKKLVDVANKHRRAEQLAPFAVTVQLGKPFASARRPPVQRG